MQKIVVIIGTRPEAIKMAPVVRELKKHADRFDCRIWLTGQHREMVEQVMQNFQLTGDVDLAIMQPGQTLSGLTARAIAALDEACIQNRPDIILVQGDTTSAFCGALVGFYHRIQVGHVEAGLRTGNRFHPYPEEANRGMITRVADWHFAPTQHAVDQLLSEGIATDSVFLTGNTVIDALLWTRDIVRQSPPQLPAAAMRKNADEQLILVTGHRRESFGDGFANICQAIHQVAEARPHARFVYPVHLNPNVREPVYRILGDHPRINLIDPLGYREFVSMMDQCTVVLTDSGGVQEEAPSLGKPVLVMRETTERPEGIAAGNARLVGTSCERIVDELNRVLDDPAVRDAMTRVANPYGDGRAAEKIVAALSRG